MTADSLIAEVKSLYGAYADAFDARSGKQIADEESRRSEYQNLEVIRIGGRSLLASMDWIFYRGDGSLGASRTRWSA